MANYRRLGTQNTTDWLLMSPQNLWEALRMVWMLWRHPNKAAILIGSPAGWIDAHARPVKLLRDIGEAEFQEAHGG